MNVSSVSVDSLASLATEMKGANIGTQIGVAVMKQIQQSQEQMAAALLQMIAQSPSPEGVGQNIDISA